MVMEPTQFEDLAVRCLTDEASTAERNELEQALAHSAEYRRRYEELQQIWQSSSEVSTQADIDRAWDELAGRLALDTPLVNEMIAGRKRIFSWRLWAAAAGVILMAGSLSFHFNRASDISGPTALAERKEKTGYGERRSIQLPDGSQIRMNVGTVLSYQADFADSIRLVRLDGEAFFEVEADGRPFIVQTPNTVVRALGTSFNVRARANKTTVIVKEGRVVMQDRRPSSSEGVVLHAGQKGLHRSGAVVSQPEMVDAESAIGWLRGEMIFIGVPIEEVAAELTLIYDVRITVEEASIRSRTITATFDESSIDVALRAICLAARADFRLENDVYLIYPRIE